MLIKLFKWITITAMLLVTLLAVAILLGNTFIPRVATLLVPKFTGYSMSIDDPYLNLWRGEMNFKGITLQKEDAFPEPKLVLIQQLAVDFDMSSLFKKQKTFSDITVDVEQVTVARKIAESVGLESLLSSLGKINPAKVFEKSEEESQAPEEKTTSTSDQPPFEYLVRKLTVRVDNIKAEAYLMGSDTPIVVEAPLMIDRTFENVTDVNSIVKPITTDVMKRSLGIMSKALTKSFASNAANITKSIGETGQSILGGIGSLFGGSNNSEDSQEVSADSSSE